MERQEYSVPQTLVSPPIIVFFIRVEFVLRCMCFIHYFFKCCDVRGSVWLSWVVSYVDSSLFCFIPVALYVQCPLFCSLGSVLFSWVASYVDSPLFVIFHLYCMLSILCCVLCVLFYYLVSFLCRFPHRFVVFHLYCMFSVLCFVILCSFVWRFSQRFVVFELYCMFRFLCFVLFVLHS